MSYLPPPAFLNNQKKSEDEQDDTNRVSSLISIETRRKDGSTYITTIYPPMVYTDEPEAKNYFFINCLFYFPELIYKFYKRIFKKTRDVNKPEVQDLDINCFK